VTWFSWLTASTSGPASSRLGAARATASASHANAITIALAEHRRPALTYTEAVDLVCRATGWPVGHLWVRSDEGWQSSGAWHDAGPQFAELKASTAETDLGSGRGIVAAVLHLEACRFLPGLEGLGSELRMRQAAALGLTAVVGVPLNRGGRLDAVFEFVTTTYVEPDGALTEALLAVAARTRRHDPVPTPIPDRRTVSLDHQLAGKLALIEPQTRPAAVVEPARHDSAAR
jgi:hypothetical protein